MELKDISVGEWHCRQRPDKWGPEYWFIKDSKNRLWVYTEPVFSDDGHKSIEEIKEKNYDSYNETFKKWVTVEPS